MIREEDQERGDPHKSQTLDRGILAGRAQQLEKKASLQDTLSAYTIKNEVNILDKDGRKPMQKGVRESFQNIDLEGSEEQNQVINEADEAWASGIAERLQILSINNSLASRDLACDSR